MLKQLSYIKRKNKKKHIMAFSMKHSSPMLQTIPGVGGTWLDTAQKDLDTASANLANFKKRPYTKEDIRNKPTKGTKTVEFENADINRLDREQVNQAADSAMAYIGRNKDFTITPGNSFKTDYYKGVQPVRANTYNSRGGNSNAITREQIKERIKTTGNAAVFGGKFVEGIKPFATVATNPQRDAQFENNRFVQDSTMASRRFMNASSRFASAKAAADRAAASKKKK